jgi:hypothetical protein
MRRTIAANGDRGTATSAESLLERGSSKQYGYAARDVRHSASLAGRVADEGGIEGHEAFVARLKREHGRKYPGFPGWIGRWLPSGPDSAYRIRRIAAVGRSDRGGRDG